MRILSQIRVPHVSSLRRGLSHRYFQLGVVLFGMILLMAADDTGTRFNKIGHGMMCVCGCGQILLECNHVGCPDSDRMIGELRTRLASGDGDTPIYNWFASKYGPTVLAAPIRGGFDTVAWVMPVVVFLLATVGTALIVRAWVRRRNNTLTTAEGIVVELPAGEQAKQDAVRERIRRETEY
ncbi:cytochrome c-type biogenesis protein [Terriglobus tenax]|uniref:cytochrome c-type biogenesis protein n=1 Tax=Terriglobus tenax TaxID=1111115 RepID=UPI0021E0D253|nr:cytochrome c-type biogenesis protein CcmH [Terriglobus tenax]